MIPCSRLACRRRTLLTAASRIKRPLIAISATG
jgi:hypothetical protein